MTKEWAHKAKVDQGRPLTQEEGRAAENVVEDLQRGQISEQMPAHINTHAHAHAHTHIHTLTHTDIHTHKHACRHIYTVTHANIQKNTQMRVYFHMHAAIKTKSRASYRG